MNVYEIVTEKIVAQLEAGTVPWQQPWRATGAPMNIASRKSYRGVNTILLGMAGYDSPWWGTYKQVKAAGGQVRGGEKSTLIVFWKPGTTKTDPETGEVRASYMMLRYYNVFNSQQCDGLEQFTSVEPPEPVSPPDAVMDVLSGYSVSTLAHGGDRAFYRVSDDHLQMPEARDFDSPAAYASTLFHELVHSTGHPNRLKRDFSGGFGSSSYAREELVAEIGAAFLCEHYGLDQIKQSADYIASWARKLRDDPKLIVSAASKAEKAVDMISDDEAREVSQVA